MTKILNILYDEHQAILKVIKALLRECEEDRLNRKFFADAIDFIRNYADKIHHAKEEAILFKELCKPGVLMHCNPIEQMLYEHEMGRNFVKGMVEGLKENNKEKIIDGANGYANLLREHISKEDDILYPMAEESLDQKTKKQILSKFKEADHSKKNEINKYALFANKLK